MRRVAFRCGNSGTKLGTDQRDLGTGACMWVCIWGGFVHAMKDKALGGEACEGNLDHGALGIEWARESRNRL